MGSRVNIMTATNYAGHSSRKIYGKIGCKSCSHMAVALRNGGDPTTGEVRNTSNQCTGRLPVVDTGRQCETSFRMTTDLPTGKYANVMTASDCIEGFCGIGGWNVIPVNGSNEMGWRRDSVEGHICWPDEGKRVKHCRRHGYSDSRDRCGVTD